jgi:cell division initiation protein
MFLTPLDIQQKQFRVRLRGFDVREVDLFLEEIADTVDALQADNARLKEELRRAKQASAKVKEHAENLAPAAPDTRTPADELQENARQSAEAILADAEARAEKTLVRTRQRLSQLQDEINDLKRQRDQMETQIRSIIDAHAKLLELGREKMTKRDATDEKGAAPKHPPVSSR